MLIQHLDRQCGLMMFACVNLGHDSLLFETSMGAVVSVAIPAITGLVLGITGLIRSIRSSGVASNPVMDELEKRATEAEEARLKAEEEHRQAEEARRMAEEQASQAEEQRRRAEEASRQAEDAMRRAEESKRQAEEQKKTAEEEKRKAEEEEGRAKVDQKAAEAAAAAADRRAKDEEAARKEAERKLREGIQPIIWPSLKEIASVKKRLQYKEGIFHFAIAGVAGSGKSSLINAFRGVRNNARGACPTGIVETTSVITRYADLNSSNPFVWYDVPGAGTLKIPDWEYFNAQGLYVFDCIIVLFDNRFTATDVAILKNCARFNIPSYIVRSKSNQHILNIETDMGYEDEDDEEKRRVISATARTNFITETRQSVERNLLEAKLPQQKVYIVSKDALLMAINERTPKDPIDEFELLHDLLSEASARRSRARPSKPTRK
ncbi:hypothetical protein EW146_g1578 [Bondarzewia mesenterica]|uniref:IRG-type G domain-containing protein n=1 Tax=Bondarzewia mesenterica TaxID=1095465 RepID=A0A4S4M3U0_9AGAM|nr:hypothetical protein EW146_g1578 [Bondarzewia mesenterica]